ncbi:MAG: alpha/beta hydrolase [Acidobacteria bacterium]|nr:alpha/beta hydrolase [Acidobacteriota bacterium]
MSLKSKPILPLLFLTACWPALFQHATAAGRQSEDSPPAAAYPPPGRLVDAGGHLLHLNCTGKGGPTVVVENGSGDFSFVWSLVQPSVARFTRICTYDRAGYAWSEPGPDPRTFQQITTELHTALRNAKVKPPYVLVGQSYGGFPARAFARYYPKEVVGMVLVDVVHEDSRVFIGGRPQRIREFAKGREFPPPVTSYHPKAEQERPPALDEASAPVNKLEPPLDRLPAEVQRLQLWAQNEPAFRRAVSAELDWSPEELARMYAERGKPEYLLGDIPLIVLTRGEGYEDKGLEEERLRLQGELARLSTNGKQVVAEGTGHNIHLENPKLVTDSIREVVEAVRRGKRITASAQNQAPPAAARAERAQQPCMSAPEHRQFDFWVGEWDVRNARGRPVGTSRIERVEDGCVIMENWAGGEADGLTDEERAAIRALDAAFVRGRLNWTYEKDGQKTNQTSRSVDLFLLTRDPSGNWHVIRQMWTALPK